MGDLLQDKIDIIKENVPTFDWDKSGFDIVSKAWALHIVDASPETLQPFVDKFIKGYNNRPSVRTSHETGTVPDHIIDELIGVRIPQFTKRDINLISFGHRLAMGAENILGLILEEFIHNKVINHDWACCWGNCIKAVDFCCSHKMLQVKNRSNTENSSSNKIRSGTRILNWYRINALNGSTNWPDLDSIIGANQLFSENEFIEYAKDLVKANPAVLFVDQDKVDELFSDG